MIEDISLLDPKIHAPTKDQLAFVDEAFLAPDVLPRLFRHRGTLTAAEFAGEVTTLGWDTTNVLRVSDVNEVLKNSSEVPKDFSIVVDESQNYKVSGEFGKWQIGLGGSGAIVFLAVPIVKGTLTSGDKTYPMDGSTLYISVKLRYIPQVPPGSSTGAQPFSVGIDGFPETDDLKTDTEDRSVTDPAVVVQNLIFPSNPPSAFVRALMIGALGEWFNHNLVQIAYVFSTVNLNHKAANEEFQWLQPTYTGYGYMDGPDLDSALFGVLNMTGGRSPEGLSNQLAPGSIPSGSRAALNIAMERYMENVVFPGLVKGFPHASKTSFTLKNNNTVIENTEDIQADKVQVGAIWYTPWIKNFVLQVVGEEIQIYTKTVTEISPGIRSVVENTSFQTIKLVTKEDGSQTLDFATTQPPRTNSYIDKDDWVTIVEIIISIAGAVAGIVAANVIKGLAKIILACVIIAIVAGLAAATPELIAAVAGGGAAAALPSIDLLVLNSTAPVHWPGSSNFTLDQVLLNGAIQLGGNAHITSMA